MSCLGLLIKLVEPALVVIMEWRTMPTAHAGQFSSTAASPHYPRCPRRSRSRIVAAEDLGLILTTWDDRLEPDNDLIVPRLSTVTLVGELRKG